MPYSSLRPRRIGVAVTAVAMTLGATTLMPSAAHATAAPANDNFGNAQVVSGAAGSASATGTNVGATTQPGETYPNAWIPNNTVWFSWTAPASGPVLFDLNGSAIDTVETVYTLSGKTLVPAGFDDDYTGNSYGASAVPVVAVAGTTYYAQVGSYSLDGTGALHLAINPISQGIQGVVKTSGGTPVPGACVTAPHTLGSTGSTSVTNAAGQYVITDSAASDTPTASNCFGDANLTQTTPAPSATTVGAGPATSAPIIVTTGASLTGRVIDQNGAPVAGASVEAWNSGTSDVTTWTDATGHYTVSGLEAGSYNVAAYDSQNNLYSATLSSVVTVPGTGTATAPDVTVHVLAGASGHVTNSTGGNYGGACITFTSGGTSTNVTADSNGYYSTALPAGTYTVSFNDNCVSPLTSIWYNGAHSAAAATPLTLTAGIVLFGVDGNFQGGGTAVPPAVPNVVSNGAPFVSPVCVADRAAASAAAAAVSSPQAAVAAANAALAAAQAAVAKDQAALKKLTKQLKVAKKKHAASTVKKLTKKIKKLKVTLRNDTAALAAAASAASSKSAAVAAAQAAVASANAAVNAAC